MIPRARDARRDRVSELRTLLFGGDRSPAPSKRRKSLTTFRLAFAVSACVSSFYSSRSNF
jgi:hypothetical protein